MRDYLKDRSFFIIKMHLLENDDKLHDKDNRNKMEDTGKIYT